MENPALWLFYPILLWWLSTGFVVAAINRAGHRPFWVLAGATLVLLGSFAMIVTTAEQRTVSAAAAAFAAGIGVWAWHEITFLLGYLTGPRTTPCPSGLRGRRRFVAALQTVITHELAIAATGLGLIAFLWGAENQVALWTYLVLWGMRLSAKLNIFLGVPSFSDELLPEHLRYLKSYFRIAPMNGFFPVSVTVGTLLGAWLLQQSYASDTDAFLACALLLPGVLMLLAVIEHWFLVLPIADSALWRGWSVSRAQTSCLTEVKARASFSDQAGDVKWERGVLEPPMSIGTAALRVRAMGGRS